MERNTPVRKPHTSTADLLTWPENPIDSVSPASSASRTSSRPHQPSDGISKVVFGGQVTDEEAASLLKRKPCSGHKLKEITGSGIFAADEEDTDSEAGSANTASNNRTGLRIYQQAVGGISQISFSVEENISPKKPTSLPEVAKQRELSGTLESETDVKLRKQPSDAKCKELSGHDIFAPPPEILPHPLASRAAELKESKDIGEPGLRNVHTSVKVSNMTTDDNSQAYKWNRLEVVDRPPFSYQSLGSLCPAGGQSNFVFGEETVMKTARKIHNQKFAELSGNDIFKEDVPPSSAEKPLSTAKLREMSGSDIFADGKRESRDYLGGVRKPPGGESSIALV
ncbi:protein of unknown function DUF4057 [Dillenia turbinata]|uniref:DUF4057 domain-containing protein n=1 Tax=Dillenia turbinata TaxID=194707 RepID=A0AAN8W1U2_9MAGN